MKRTTHLVMGCAAAAPVAVALDLPAEAVGGCVMLGIVGGQLPDYLDLRSIFHPVLRHRGVSHSLLTAALATLATWVVLRWLAGSDGSGALPDTWIRPWTAAMALGLLSHLGGDACTTSGIQPWLPFSRRKFWILPRSLRGRSDGWLNGAALLGSAGILALCGMALERL